MSTLNPKTLHHATGPHLELPIRIRLVRLAGEDGRPGSRAVYVRVVAARQHAWQHVFKGAFGLGRFFRCWSIRLVHAEFQKHCQEVYCNRYMGGIVAITGGIAAK